MQEPRVGDQGRATAQLALSGTMLALWDSLTLSSFLSPTQWRPPQTLSTYLGSPLLADTEAQSPQTSKLAVNLTQLPGKGNYHAAQTRAAASLRGPLSRAPPHGILNPAFQGKDRDHYSLLIREPRSGQQPPEITEQGSPSDSRPRPHLLLPAPHLPSSSPTSPSRPTC